MGNDDSVQYLWSVLEEDFSPKQRSKFLEFVWAKARLPSMSRISRTFQIIKKEFDNPDIYLPSARTCFFELTLPEYSSRDVMREKLAFAIDIKGMSDHDV